MHSHCDEHHCDCCHHDEKKKTNLTIRLICGSAIFSVGIFTKSLPLYVLAYIILGYDVVINAVSSIRNLFNENFLMTLATVGAFAIGEYPEAVAVMLFYQIGEALSHTAEGKSKKSIEALMDLKVDRVRVKKDGEFVLLPCEKVEAGETILVTSGERVPLDGIITSGSASFDTSALTGEAEPIRLSENQSVMSGTVNLDSAVEIKTSGTYSESTVAKILELVRTQNKSHSEKFITKFAKIYTPAVVFLAIFIAIVGSITTGDIKRWIYTGLTFLVVSCPCALVVSVPLTFFAGIGRSSKEGILVKGGYALENLAKIQHVAFDKTGTLTKGTFSVQKIISKNEEILKYAAYAEAYSSHPIGKAIVKKYEQSIDFSLISDFRETAGGGVTANVLGKEVIIGSKLFLENNGILCPDAQRSCVYLGINGGFAGSIYISDSLKSDVHKSLTELKKMKIKTTILTGDSKENTAPIASELENDFYFGLLPQDKVSILSKLQKNGKCAFVGDGINDAPVISTADVGISMGGLGSDAAIEASDIVIMTDDISKIPKAVNIARKTVTIATENIIFALGIKLIIMIMGVYGITTMWLSVFADVGVCILAVLNAIRALRIR